MTGRRLVVATVLALASSGHEPMSSSQVALYQSSVTSSATEVRRLARAAHRAAPLRHAPNSAERRRGDSAPARAPGACDAGVAKVRWPTTRGYTTKSSGHDSRPIRVPLATCCAGCGSEPPASGAAVIVTTDELAR